MGKFLVYERVLLIVDGRYLGSKKKGGFGFEFGFEISDSVISLSFMKKTHRYLRTHNKNKKKG